MVSEGGRLLIEIQTIYAYPKIEMVRRTNPKLMSEGGPIIRIHHKKI